ncbi:MAG: hypothetical protein IKA54_02620 [Clostridia bacterium]|jgi:uncharacterized membrane protein YsdA (DUF1294 family)|nr:hypothetical protein [Clostridia bacterium]
MIVLIRILIAVYLIAINFYAFMLVRAQKIQRIEDGESKVKDGKLFLTGAIGGALGIFISTFILSYRKDSLLLMVVMPLLFAVTAYFLILGFMTDFNFF